MQTGEGGFFVSPGAVSGEGLEGVGRRPLPSEVKTGLPGPEEGGRITRGVTRYEQKQKSWTSGVLPEGVEQYRVEPGAGGTGFYGGLRETSKQHKFGAAVEVKKRAFYKDPETRLYLAPDATAGAAVTPDGDLVSVFRQPGSAFCPSGPGAPTPGRTASLRPLTSASPS